MKYTSFRPGQIWLDTNGKRIQAHGGSVIYSGQTGERKHVIEFSLKLDSNPEFTGSVLAAVARAAWRMNREGQRGAKTMFDIAPKYLSPQTAEWLRAHML